MSYDKKCIINYIPVQFHKLIDNLPIIDNEIIVFEQIFNKYSIILISNYGKIFIKFDIGFIEDHDHIFCFEYFIDLQKLLNSTVIKTICDFIISIKRINLITNLHVKNLYTQINNIRIIYKSCFDNFFDAINNPV